MKLDLVSVPVPWQTPKNCCSLLLLLLLFVFAIINSYLCVVNYLDIFLLSTRSLDTDFLPRLGHMLLALFLQMLYYRLNPLQETSWCLTYTMI